MKRTIHFMLFGAIFLAALVGLAPVAHARSCSLAGVAGNYGYTVSGAIPILSLGAVASVGHFTTDAAGNFTGAQTTSFNGAIVEETLSGMITVNADCTGTAIINVFHGTTLVRTTHLNVVYVNNQSALRAIFLTAGTVLTVEANKTFHEVEE